MPYALYRQAVENAIKGKKGQALLKDLEAALLGMAKKRLISGVLCKEGEVCALGALAVYRGKLDPFTESLIDADATEISGWARSVLKATDSLSTEIQWENDAVDGETPEECYERVLRWTRAQLT